MTFESPCRNPLASVEIILNKIHITPTSVLDIGAGYGEIASYIASKSIKVTAIEPDKELRQSVKKQISQNVIYKKYLKLINAHAEKLPVESKSIDLCILSQVLEHVSDPQKTVREIARVLKPGGYLYLSCPNYLYPIEQHYHIPYLPLMNKELIATWASFFFKVFRKMDEQNIEEIGTSILGLNFITDQMIKKLTRDNKLEIIWSSSKDSQNLLKQISKHLNGRHDILKLFFVFLSLPIKILRSILSIIGWLPMKLEYLIIKAE